MLDILVVLLTPIPQLFTSDPWQPSAGRLHAVITATASPRTTWQQPDRTAVFNTGDITRWFFHEAYSVIVSEAVAYMCHQQTNLRSFPANENHVEVWSSFPTGIYFLLGFRDQIRASSSNGWDYFKALQNKYSNKTLFLKHFSYNVKVSSSFQA